MTDPPVRPDNRCARKGCGKHRSIPRSGYASRAQHESDPFCSRPCCEAHHGIAQRARKPIRRKALGGYAG